MNLIGKATLLLVSLCLVSSLHLERHHQRQISRQCCLSQGGFQCGTVVKDCCVLPKGVQKEKASAQNCVKGGLLNSSQYCPGQKITTECNYCHKICESKGGKLCGWQNTGADQCCKQSDCIPDVGLDFKMKKCKPGTQIKLSACVVDMNLSDQVFGKLNGVVS